MQIRINMKHETYLLSSKIFIMEPQGGSVGRGAGGGRGLRFPGKHEKLIKEDRTFPVKFYPVKRN